MSTPTASTAEPGRTAVPRLVTTLADLQALPVGAVLVAETGQDALIKHDATTRGTGLWFVTGDDVDGTDLDVARDYLTFGPLLLVWDGNVTATASRLAFAALTADDPDTDGDDTEPGA